MTMGGQIVLNFVGKFARIVMEIGHKSVQYQISHYVTASPHHPHPQHWQHGHVTSNCRHSGLPAIS